MRQIHPIHLAGYQSGTSILTAALTTLARRLDGGAVGTPHLLTDVTTQGEAASSLFAAVESGERQVCYMASGYLSARVPELQVLDLPFSVRHRSQSLAALDSQAGHMLRDAVSRQSGFHVLAFWDNGFRHISSQDGPLRSPQDCQGKVIRTLDSALYRDTLEALGFSALTTDVKDLIRVVKDGTVHAQENPLTNLLSFDLWQYHRFVSLSQHFFGVLLLLCHREWYEQLNEAQQSELLVAVETATVHQRQAAAAQDSTALERLRELGVTVTPPEDMDLAAMRKSVAPVNDRYLQALAPELVQAYLGSDPLATAPLQQAHS